MVHLKKVLSDEKDHCKYSSPDILKEQVNKLFLSSTNQLSVCRPISVLLV